MAQHRQYGFAALSIMPRITDYALARWPRARNFSVPETPFRSTGVSNSFETTHDPQITVHI